MCSQIKIDPILENLKNRDSERYTHYFHLKNVANQKYKINFIKHSSDIGVMRNGGRRGSMYAPKAILNTFKKMAAHNNDAFLEIEVSNQNQELTDFQQSQVKQTEQIEFVIKNVQSEFHVFLGGGHDHIYPSLMALSKIYPNKQLAIINIDPHLDIRIDPLFHSGTPFRQFDKNTTNVHSLTQIGTHDFANVKTSLSPLKNINQKIIKFDELKNQTDHFNNAAHFLHLNFKKDERLIYFLSIDIDAIASETMEAVSAVNHRGIPLSFIEDIIIYFKQNLNCQYYGLYEYNPLFDNLSQKGARSIAGLINLLNS